MILLSTRFLVYVSSQISQEKNEEKKVKLPRVVKMSVPLNFSGVTMSVPLDIKRIRTRSNATYKHVMINKSHLMGSAGFILLGLHEFDSDRKIL